MTLRARSAIRSAGCDCEYPCSCVVFEGKRYGGGAYGVADALIGQRDELREIIARAARLCEGRDTAMVLQVLREADR